MDQSRGRSIFYVQPHAEYTIYIYSSSSPKFIYVCKNLSFTMLNYLRSNPSTARTHCGWNRFFRRAERNGTELLNIHLRADARSSNIRYWPHRNNTTSQRFGYEELGWLWSRSVLRVEAHAIGRYSAVEMRHLLMGGGYRMLWNCKTKIACQICNLCGIRNLWLSFCIFCESKFHCSLLETNEKMCSF